MMIKILCAHSAAVVLCLGTLVACGSDPGTAARSSDGGASAAGTSGASGASGSTGAAAGAGGTAGSNAAGSSGSSGSSGAGSGGSGGSAGDVGLTAKEAAAGMGRGFNLGQMFENAQHDRSLSAAQQKIDAYYEKGFRHVRLPITWTELVGGDLLVNDPALGDVNREHPRLAVIAQIVDYALSLPEMYVVINAHHEDALKTENRADALGQLWSDIADIFKDRDKRLIFELLNEPHLADRSAMAPDNLRNMSAKAYAAIRAVDVQRIAVIGGNQWFAAHEMALVWTSLDQVGSGQDAYLMATFHHYSPWSFCGDNQGSYDDAWTDADISGPIETMKSWADGVGQGMPFFIGEWGVGWGSRYAAMDCNNIRLWYQKFDAEVASAIGVPTSVWDDGGWFKIYDHGSNSFANNLIDCIGGTCEWNGAERYNSACE